MTGFKAEIKSTTNNLRARFFLEDVEHEKLGGDKEGNVFTIKQAPREMIEIAFKGNITSDSTIRKVTAADIAQWPVEYQQFKLGTPDIEIGGTPLMDLPGMVPEKMRHYKLNGIRNAEELSAISDAICANVGMGALTDRTIARNHLAAKQLEMLQQAQASQAAAVTAKLARSKPAEAAN